MELEADTSVMDMDFLAMNFIVGADDQNQQTIIWSSGMVGYTEENLSSSLESLEAALNQSFHNLIIYKRMVCKIYSIFPVLFQMIIMEGLHAESKNGGVTIDNQET